MLLFLPGDEVLAVNGESLAGSSHAEAIAVFRNIRAGKVVLHVVRRNSGPHFTTEPSQQQPAAAITDDNCSTA